MNQLSPLALIKTKTYFMVWSRLKTNHSKFSVKHLITLWAGLAVAFYCVGNLYVNEMKPLLEGTCCLCLQVCIMHILPLEVLKFIPSLNASNKCSSIYMVRDQTNDIILKGLEYLPLIPHYVNITPIKF